MGFRTVKFDVVIVPVADKHDRVADVSVGIVSEISPLAMDSLILDFNLTSVIHDVTSNSHFLHFAFEHLIIGGVKVFSP